MPKILYHCSTNIVAGQEYTTTNFDQCTYLRGSEILTSSSVQQPLIPKPEVSASLLNTSYGSSISDLIMMLVFVGIVCAIIFLIVSMIQKYKQKQKEREEQLNTLIQESKKRYEDEQFKKQYEDEQKSEAVQVVEREVYIQPVYERCERNYDSECMRYYIKLHQKKRKIKRKIKKFERCLDDSW